jgi:cytochrome P450
MVQSSGAADHHPATVHEQTVDVLQDIRGGREELAAAAESGPTAVDALTGAVWVLHYDEVDRLAHDPRMAGVGLTWFDLMGIEGELRRWYGSLMFTNEGETHTRLRQLVSRAFTPRSAERLRAHASALVDDGFTELAGAGGGDLVAVFGRLAIRVMCRLLGVPEEDVTTFGGWADALSPVFGLMDPDQIAAARSALAELVDYISRLVDDRHGENGDDLISALLRAEDEEDRLTRDEVVTMVTNLLVAGHDTTSSQIGCSLLCLLLHPEEVDRLRSGACPVPAAVVETMRFEPSIPLIPRTVTDPLEIGGIVRPAGTSVLLSVMTANRDPAVWERPDTFDVDRFNQPSPPRMLSFGTGPHYCLGASLARMTLEEMVNGLASREVSPAGDLDRVEWRLVLGRSPAALPVVMG